MPDKTFKLEIVTPRKIVFSGDVQSFSAPGSVGGFQVLYNHAPLLAEITVGEVKLKDGEGNERRFATSGGFVDVLNNHVTLLAETAEAASEIDILRAESAQERARKRLAERSRETDIARAQSSLARALNRLKVAQRS